MPQQPPISVFVILGYWDLYRSNVVLMATVFRKLLYIWGFVALLWFTLSVLLLFRPSPEQDWAVIMQNASPLKWVLGLPVLFVFVLPLLSARRLLKDWKATIAGQSIPIWVSWIAFVIFTYLASEGFRQARKSQ